eukprot:NODE_17140_length_959_cov_8.812500.p1 GENE.NODE_17140_length_959_cov_8.812500~~NODE_17140_length_959_cov_8.812500.p1  ORF type:complete len:197 (-),score=35.00 NODE_17140_length_959_cov_8.812500:243-833(-)
MEDLREIGDEAAWSLSSAKPGNGVEQLRDGNTETFWQSDGSQPHLINIQFQRKVRVSELRLYTNHKVDESYTPSCISVRIGTARHDLQEVQVVDLKEPDGWVLIRLAQPRGQTRGQSPPPPLESVHLRDADCGGAVDFLRTHFIQVAVLSNHQNGRDTHIRQIQVCGPQCNPRPRHIESCALRFQTAALQQFSTIR